MTIRNEFKFGDLVYVVSDNEQLVRQVVRIIVDDNGFTYELTCNGELSEHYPFEVTRDKTVR